MKKEKPLNLNQITKSFESDIKFILRDYPFKEISISDISHIKNLFHPIILQLSHKYEKGTRLGMYFHYQRIDFKSEIRKRLDDIIEAVINRKRLIVVQDSYKKIKKGGFSAPSR